MLWLRMAQTKTQSLAQHFFSVSLPSVLAQKTNFQIKVSTTSEIEASPHKPWQHLPKTFAWQLLIHNVELSKKWNNIHAKVFAECGPKSGACTFNAEMMFSHSIASAWSRKPHGVVLAFEIQLKNTNYGLKRLYGPNNVSTRFVAWFPPRRWQSVQTNLFMHAFAVLTCKPMFRFLSICSSMSPLYVSSLCLLSMSPVSLFC